MKRVLSASLLLAATLSAQCPCPAVPAPPNMIRQLNGNEWHAVDGDGHTRIHKSVQGYDGNGALEAFYAKPAHHGIFKSKRFWIAVGAVAGSAALTGYLASRSSAYRHGAPMVPQQPGQLAPTVDSVARIGIGGPNIPVVVVKGGAN